MNENKDFMHNVDSNVPPRANRPRRVSHYFSAPPTGNAPDENLGAENGYDGDEFDYIEEPPGKKSSAPMIIAIVAAVVVVLGAAGFLGYLFFFSGNGNTESSAARPVETTEATTAETVPDTQPLTENGVAKLVTMPDLSGLTEAEAYQKLNAADVKYKVKREYSDDVKLNYVISQSPEAGTEFSRTIGATISISKGKENEIVPTPTSAMTTKPQSSKSDDDDDSSKNSSTSGDYLLPNSDSKYLSKSDLEGFGRRDLNLALNEIYARHGRKFSDSDISSYFNSKSWYHGTVSPSDFDLGVLNSYENYNIDLILEYQSELGYR